MTLFEREKYRNCIDFAGKKGYDDQEVNLFEILK